MKRTLLSVAALGLAVVGCGGSSNSPSTSTKSSAVQTPAATVVHKAGARHAKKKGVHHRRVTHAKKTTGTPAAAPVTTSESPVTASATPATQAAAPATQVPAPVTSPPAPTTSSPPTHTTTHTTTTPKGGGTTTTVKPGGVSVCHPVCGGY